MFCRGESLCHTLQMCDAYWVGFSYLTQLGDFLS